MKARVAVVLAALWLSNAHAAGGQGSAADQDLAQREYAAAKAVDECYYSGHSMYFAVTSRDAGRTPEFIVSSLAKTHGYYAAKAMGQMLFLGPKLSPEETAEAWYQSCRSAALSYYGVPDSRRK